MATDGKSSRQARPATAHAKVKEDSSCFVDVDVACEDASMHTCVHTYYLVRSSLAGLAAGAISLVRTWRWLNQDRLVVLPCPR